MCLELLLKYLNETRGCNYAESPVYELMDGYLGRLQKTNPWGYSVPYLLSAKNGVNPNYVGYAEEKGLTVRQMEFVFSAMHARGQGIIFDPQAFDLILSEIKA